MSLEMVLTLVDQEQLEYLRSRPELVDDFLAGTKPTTTPSLWRRLLGSSETAVAPPELWPSSPPESECVGVNHHNVEVFHFLLNGTTVHVAGGGCIFESWYRPEICGDVMLSPSYMGMTPLQVRELLQKVESLSRSTIQTRWDEYREIQPDEDDSQSVDYFLECFDDIRSACAKAQDEQKAVLCTAV